MAKYKKYWWSILVIAALIYISILNIRINKIKDSNQLQAVELSTLKDSVTVYKAKNGDLTYKLSVVEISHSNLKESLDIAGYDIKKLKADNIKWRKLTDVLKLELKAAGHVETAVHDTFRIENTDTIYYSKVNDWSNNYLSLFNAKVETKKLFFDYSYKTGISIFQEESKKGTIVTVKLTDTNASITTANSITVVPKKTIWQKWWLWTAAGLTTGILIAK